MTEKYSIDCLVETFKEHDKLASESYEKAKKRHLEEYGEEFPRYPYDDFSISLALMNICKEIQHIKQLMSSSNN